MLVVLWHLLLHINPTTTANHYSDTFFHPFSLKRFLYIIQMAPTQTHHPQVPSLSYLFSQFPLFELKPILDPKKLTPFLLQPSSLNQGKMASDALESILVGVKTQQRQQQEPRKPSLQPEQSLKCPRCDSNNTKFCYYNNYSLSQPRYFCKSCRRYWTKGGILRNVPVGGGCRKNKRVSSARRNHDSHFVSPDNNGALGGLVNAFDSSDLALAFARLQKQGTTNNGNGPHQFGLDDQGLDQGDYTVGVPRLGLLDSIRSGIFEADSINSGGNFYFGPGNANSREVDYDHVAAMQQELSSGENVMLFGFPWPMNANGNGNSLSGGINNIGGEVIDTGRSSVSWNGGLNSSRHHGLLNTSLLM